MAMIRKQIYIAPRQQRTLHQLVRATGKTEAQIIRDALDEHARNHHEKEARIAAWREIEATIEERSRLPRKAARVALKREELYDRYEHSRGHKRSRVSV
jgi:hypothetical protein